SAEFSRQIQALTAELQALRERSAAPEPPHEAAPEASAADAPSAVHEEAPEAGAADTPPAAEAGQLLAMPSEVPAARRRCKGITRSGEPCAAPPLKGQDYCRVHARQRVLEEVT